MKEAQYFPASNEPSIRREEDSRLLDFWTFPYSNPFIICAILLNRSFTFANTVLV